MNCPYCAQEMKPLDGSALLSCSGATWAPHDAITCHAGEGAFETKSMEIANWFKENGYTVNHAGATYTMRKKKGVLERLFAR
jgi:hypothetical protein